MKTIRNTNSGFTLIEVMVSSALIVVIMGFLMYTMDQTQRTMRGADSRVNQFQTARVAFEAMTRNLSQATLNTFWDLDMGKTETEGKLTPMGYRRNSDLHYISGKASAPLILNSKENINPTHAVFFQAPLGVTFQDNDEILTSNGYTEDKDSDSKITESKRKYRFLSGLMNVCGYYIHWGPDPRIPKFLKDEFGADKTRLRYRYRLTEVVQPSETVTIYNNPWYTRPERTGRTGENNFVASATADNARSKIYKGATDWIRVAVGKEDPTLGPKTDYSRPLADNIVAMIIVPKVPESDRKVVTNLDDLSVDYEYNSRPQKVYDASQAGSNPSFAKGTTQINKLLKDSSTSREFTQYAQLPPIVQVTLVAIDDESAARLEASLDAPENGPTEHWADGLFTALKSVQDFNEEIGDPARPDDKSLLGRLSGSARSRLPKMNYRIFTTDVVMRSAKWSNPNYSRQ